MLVLPDAAERLCESVNTVPLDLDMVLPASSIVPTAELRPLLINEPAKMPIDRQRKNRAMLVSKILVRVYLSAFSLSSSECTSNMFACLLPPSSAIEYFSYRKCGSGFDISKLV